MITPSCYICGNTRGLQEHHIIPQATGGESGPTVWLDATCHQLVHAQALNILSKQENRQLFPDDQMERAMKVVRFAVLAIRRERENPNFYNPATFSLKTSKGMISLLHVLKAEAGYTNLNTYIEDVLRRQIAARFPGFGTNREHRQNPVKSET